MNRIIRDFSRCSKFDKLSLLAEVFFRRLWNKADDYGRYDANPKLLKADLFPLRDIRSSDIVRCLQECETAELLVCYQIENAKYLQINNFNQSVRTKNAKYPPMDSNCISIAHQLHSKCSLEKEDEDEEEKNIKKEKLLTESAERIWQAYPKKDGKMKGIEAIINVLKRGESEEYLIERVKLYSQSRSVQQGFIMNAQGWFNQKRYTDESLDKPIPQGDVNCITLEEFKRKFNRIFDPNFMDVDEDSTDRLSQMVLFARRLKSVEDFKNKYPNEYLQIINRKEN